MPREYKDPFKVMTTYCCPRCKTIQDIEHKPSAGTRRPCAACKKKFFLFSTNVYNPLYKGHKNATFLKPDVPDIDYVALNKDLQLDRDILVKMVSKYSGKPVIWVERQVKSQK